jgi:hypothetical protein
MQPPEDLERALSIRQPIVELILTTARQFEFRSRPTPLRGRVYLYAAKTITTVDGFDPVKALALPRGLIVGSVDIVDCLSDEDGDFDGLYAWELGSPVRYRQPLLAHGTPQPGFWRPTF